MTKLIALLILATICWAINPASALPIDYYGDHLVELKVVSLSTDLCKLPAGSSAGWDSPKLTTCIKPVRNANITLTEMKTDNQDLFNWVFIVLGCKPEYTPRDPVSAYTAENGSVVFSMMKSLKYQIVIENQTESISRTIFLYPYEDSYTIYLKRSEPA